jgi:hypothetical protein
LVLGDEGRLVVEHLNASSGQQQGHACRLTVPRCALVTTIFAFFANLRVDTLSAAILGSAAMVQTMATRALPPREDCSRRVSFESR